MFGLFNSDERFKKDELARFVPDARTIMVVLLALQKRDKEYADEVAAKVEAMLWKDLDRFASKHFLTSESVELAMWAEETGPILSRKEFHSPVERVLFLLPRLLRDLSVPGSNEVPMVINPAK